MAVTAAAPTAPLLATDALHQRLTVTAEALGVPVAPAPAGPGAATSVLFTALVEHVHRAGGVDRLWLLLTALSAAFPDPDDLLAARRARDLHSADDFAAWLLESCFRAAVQQGSASSEMDVVTGTVVDVDFTARHELHTGIQRVVRETVPRWARDHELTLVAWTEQGGAMRRLADAEADRVLRWHELPRRVPAADTGVTRPQRLVVPWRTSVVLPENPASEHCSMLAAMALYSGNDVALVGYDCIPVISPELIHQGLPDRFTRYLEAVKHAQRVVGISAAAALEFRGFADMLAAQGLPGPAVTVCPLPMETPQADPVPRADPPLVVSIGSFEPRKNQLAVLHAAEELWREGRRFALTFIGGGGWVTEADAVFARLVRAGRPVRRATAIADAELWRTLRSARFSMFVSLHEGYGLPVAESLACGTPVITSDFGSMAEIAAQGGALVVDPHDDRAIAAQMRRLLTDDDLVEQLRRDAARRPRRTWDEYARESWAALVEAATPAGQVRS